MIRSVVPRPGEKVDWAVVVDVLGVTHAMWRYNFTPARWHRLCLDHGPEIYTKPEDLPLDTPVTCLWCLSVERTL
jgi:hypothetical protein